MKTANIGQVKEQLSAYVTEAEKGETVLICRRNRPVARIVPVEPEQSENCTHLGSARGSVEVLCDLTQPGITEEDWDILQ